MIDDLPRNLKDGWLYGWQDIADYVGCSVKTARRYAKHYHLPIRRFPSKKLFAVPSDLDKWARGHNIGKI
jgi:hypothetical protein